MSKLAFVGLALCAVALSMPLSAADHGLNAVYAVPAGNVAIATYVSGFGAAQTWAFAFNGQLPAPFPALPAGDRCVGFGSLEGGFAGSCASGSTFRVSGSGVFHGYPNYAPEVDQGITITYGGASASGVLVVAPDIGRPL